MNQQNSAKYPPLDELLAKLSPSRQEEVRHRTTQGDIPFMPEDVRLEKGRVYFPEIGWVDAPGMDPAELPLDDIELFFLLARGDGYLVEARLKTRSPVSDGFKALRKLSAFRSKSALDKYLRKASPGVSAEVLSRLKRGQLPFLPENVRFERGGIYLGPEFFEMPGLDPKDIVVNSIVLLFVIHSPLGDKLEILSRTQ